MRPKHKRLVFVISLLSIMAISVTIMLIIFRQNLIYFYTPSMLLEAMQKATFENNRVLRLGGLVEPGSLAHQSPDGIAFLVTDGKAQIHVQYRGLLPTLFREGQGVVLLGKLEADKSITASEILAKHDETYMPAEVARALKASGHWKTDGQNYPSSVTPGQP